MKDKKVKTQIDTAKTNNSGKGNSQEKIEKKGWQVRTFDGKHEVLFQPIFKINTAPDAANVMGIATDKDIECRFVDVIFDHKRERKEFRFNFLDLFMFMYTCANEELRQQLNLRYERNFSKIPYNVTFNLTPQEKEAGQATRLIELEVDEIAMAMARAEARKYAGRDSGDYNSWVLKKKGVDMSKIKNK